MDKTNIIIDFNSIFQKKEEILTRQIVGETLLVPIYGELANMEEIFMLDPVAEFIWNLLDGKNNLKHICENLLDTFDVKNDQAEADVSEFVNDLIEADLIVEVR